MKKKPTPPPELPDNQVRLVGLQGGDAWKVEMLETPHAWCYMFTQRAAVVVGPGRLQYPWVLSPHSMCIIKPEWQAAATRVQGEALASVQGKIAAAAQPPCDECGGKPRDPDGPPCWKCHGRGTA